MELKKLIRIANIIIFLAIAASAGYYFLVQKPADDRAAQVQLEQETRAKEEAAKKNRTSQDQDKAPKDHLGDQQGTTRK